MSEHKKARPSHSQRPDARKQIRKLSASVDDHESAPLPTSVAVFTPQAKPQNVAFKQADKPPTLDATDVKLKKKLEKSNISKELLSSTLKSEPELAAVPFAKRTKPAPKSDAALPSESAITLPRIDPPKVRCHLVVVDE